MNNLEKNITQLHKEKGRQWLSDLPGIIDALSNKWSLSDIQPVDNMSWHYVAFAVQNKKKPVVLKIGCDDKVLRDEYRALRYFNGQSVISVIDYDPEHAALLLKHAIPGNLLSEYVDKEQALLIYANTVRLLHYHQKSTDDFTHVSDWCRSIDRITDVRINQSFVDLAKQLCSFLLSSVESEILCHGDLHCENVIQNNDQWVVIDPKGVVGELAFEAAAFDFLSDDELKDSQNVADLFLSRIKILSEALSINNDRLLSWVFLRAIMSAQWFVEDGGDPSSVLLIAKHVYQPVLNLLENA